jgi:hypothetical protein
MKKVRLYEEFITEASRSEIHKAAKKGSYPATIIVVEDDKVVYQEQVNTPMETPAAFNVIQKEYPNAKLSIEDSTGKVLYTDK